MVQVSKFGDKTTFYETIKIEADRSKKSASLLEIKEDYEDYESKAFIRKVFTREV